MKAGTLRVLKKKRKEMFGTKEAVSTLILSDVYWALPLQERLVLIKYLRATY